MKFSEALSFRAKLLLAMMLVVAAVTGATLYLAEKSLRANHDAALNAQFQNQVRSFLAVQKVQSREIADKCRALSRSVRLRAALEEGDLDDLYRNGLTELQGILAEPNSNQLESPSARASFFRFFYANGTVVPTAEYPAGLTDEKTLDEALAPMGEVLPEVDEQSVGFIALRRGNQLTVLREVVLTKIYDWKGRSLGALVLGFPITQIQSSDADQTFPIKSGIWLNQKLYIDGLPASDRHLIVRRIDEMMTRAREGRVAVVLETGPHLLFYKPLDPRTQFTPAYQVCLYPLAASLRQEQALRWRVIAFGLLVLLCGFVISLLLARGLSKPVDRIVAGSVQNLAKRKEAEENLVEVNRELKKALADLKSTQQQVIQQERLSAIGQMASGIAHDFNNTLMPIMGFADLLLTNQTLLDDKAETRKCLEMLRTAAKDAVNVVYRLREFYRPIANDEEFPVVDLAKIVQQAVSLTEPKWRHQAQANGLTISISTEFAALPIVAGDESALREVLTNLIFNAVDAMPEGGGIALETSIIGDRAVLKVRDTGTGMTEAVRQRCLEPFFSTKGEQGTGLGLSMVYGIVERHRGQLEIQSKIGKGTTFIIKLPLAEEMPLEASTISAATTARSSSLKVLIVDDDPRIREVLSIYLRCDGHQAVTAVSGREALEKFRRGRFDLVVVDRAMPEMSGEQTARFIKQLNQNTPIIMLTGFGALREVTGSQPQAVDVVLDKPITVDSLRRTIDKLLPHAA